MRLILIQTLLAAVATFGLRAQTVDRRPTFEAVSIKPVDQSQLQRQGPPRTDPGRVSYSVANLKFLINKVYNVAPNQINGPSWIETNFFTLAAKIPDGVSEDQIPAMLQTMLADRFALKVHWEARVQPVFALLVGKGGPKLKKSDLSVAWIGPDGKPASGVQVIDAGHYRFRAITMAQLARYLSNLLGRPVLDLTEIPGEFDFDFDANPVDLGNLRKELATEGISSSGSDSSYASIFTGLQDLGLKLEAPKKSIDYLIVDSALKVPTEN